MDNKLATSLVALKRIVTITQDGDLELAEAILEANGNAIPLYLVSDGNLANPQYQLATPSLQQKAILAACRKAKEIDIRKGEMVIAIILDKIPEKQGAIAKQLELLR